MGILDGREAALDYLEETAAAFPKSLDNVDCAEEIRELRGDARYIALLDQVGFPGRGGAGR